MIRLSGERLTVRKSGRTILSEVSIEAAGGAFVGVIGPNGAGKSTLLACLAGLLRPDAGAVHLDGAPIDRLGGRVLARRRAYLPQGARAEWPIAVERLVALGLTPHLPAFGGLPEALSARIETALTDADLLERRDQAATTLSGGELARAMLARALVGDPDLLIADEPLAGLDPRHALDCVARLRGLANAGKLVIASLHELTLAARTTTHIAVLRDGRLIAFGPTATIFTSALLRDAFDVDACVTGAGRPDAMVDFVGLPMG